MATSSITNTQALAAMLAYCEESGWENADAIAKVRRHLEVLSKPKAKSDLPSKTQRLNATLCEEVYSFLCDRGSATPKQVAEQLGSPYITTSQKATILLGILTTQGRAVRESEKGRVWWVPVTDSE